MRWCKSADIPQITCRWTVGPCVDIGYSIGTQNPVSEEVDHSKIAIGAAVMDKVQFLFPSEPCIALKP
jgi:hypothetical protein